MKKLILCIALLLSCVIASAKSGKDIYKKYSGKEDVDAVYISPAMFKMMGKIPDMEIEDSDVNLTSVIKSLDGLYVIDSENLSVNLRLVSDVEKLAEASKYELLMEANDAGEKTKMYVMSEGDYILSFMLLTIDSDECAFICIDGKMLRDEMMALIGQAVAE